MVPGAFQFNASIHEGSIPQVAGYYPYSSGPMSGHVVGNQGTRVPGRNASEDLRFEVSDFQGLRLILGRPLTNTTLLV